MTEVEEGLQIIGRNQGAKIRLSKNHKIAMILFKCPICKKKSHTNLFCTRTKMALRIISKYQHTQLICQSCEFNDEEGWYIIDTKGIIFAGEEESQGYYKLRKAYKKLGWID